MSNFDENQIAKNLIDNVYNSNYDERAEYYDQEISRINRKSCDVIANLISIFVDDKNAKILDIAAGTGLVAVSLNKNGYNNIDGLDPSVKMLNKAKEKSLYRNYFFEGIYAGKKTSIEDNTYDHIVCSASMDDDGLIKFESIKEFLRMMKKDGYAFIVDRDYFYLKSKESNEKIFKKLEDDNKLKIIINCQFKNYIKNDLACLDGRIVVFQKF